MSDSRENFSFNLPIASSSPEPTLNISSLQEKLEREIEVHRDKADRLKLQIVKECQLMLLNLPDGVYYEVTDEENCQSNGSILRKSERNAKKAKSGLNNNSSQCVVSLREVLREKFEPFSEKIATKLEKENSKSPLGTANSAGSSRLLKKGKIKFARIEDKEYCQPVVLERSQPGRNVKRTNSQISVTCIQSGATSSGQSSSKSSALKEDKICDPKYMISVKANNYKVACVTPNPNIKSSSAILRKPKPGEMVISMTGSPLLVSSIQESTHLPQISIPIDDEKILTVLGKESLDANDFPVVDSVTKARLAKLHNFLGKVIQDEK